MSTTWYKTGGHRWGVKPLIETVTVEKFTDKSLWIRARNATVASRTSIHSDYAHYYPTWGEAYAALVAASERDLQSARIRLQQAQGTHGNIVGMKEPTP